ncbi:hypothetical protein GO495_17660 [Chitinophaga oryziterrae]|uniref:Uncharacterized protein n=1 Tax=Chitinophaga oryziterrae TaxID=1031224 RepID=A0A6N8JBT9_9BACT|nr:hypothetical protein [Chitinophaga oryziterrae]MVT42424.1 hypothetical protein [Chitinophaga oryziterrae]
MKALDPNYTIIKLTKDDKRLTPLFVVLIIAEILQAVGIVVLILTVLLRH